LNVRPGAVVISLGSDGPSIVLGARAAWIFHREAPPTAALAEEEFLPAPDRIQVTVQRLRDRFLEVEEGRGQSGDAREASLGSASVADQLPVPFPLGVAEAVLALYVEKLEVNVRQQVKAARRLGVKIEKDITSSGDMLLGASDFERIRVLKQRLGRIDSAAGSLRQTLFETLGDEDDMQSLERGVCSEYLCTAEDWELCFEYYLQKAEDIQLDAQRETEDLEDLESLIGLSLSRRRLELEQFNLGLGILASGFSFAAVLTGAFGMNLLSGLEDRRHGFVFASVVIVALSTGICVGLSRVAKLRLRRRRPPPRRARTSPA